MVFFEKQRAFCAMAIAACEGTDYTTTDREFSLLERGTKRLKYRTSPVIATICGGTSGFHVSGQRPVPALGKSYRDRDVFLRSAWGSGVLEREAYFVTDSAVVCLEIAIPDEESVLIGSAQSGMLRNLGNWVSACCGGEEEECNILYACLPVAVYDAINDGIVRATQEKTSKDVIAALSPVSFAKTAFKSLVKDKSVKLSDGLTMGASMMAVAAIAGYIADQRARLVTVFEGVAEEVEYSEEDVANECGELVARRVPETEHKDIRDGVTVIPFTEEQLEENAQRNGTVPRHLREVCTSTDRLIGPPIFASTASLDTDVLETEYSGVKRHLNKKKQLEYAEGAKERFDEAADLVCGILLESIESDDVYEPKLPEGWTDATVDEAVAQLSEQRPAQMKGFAKPKEVGLPVDKDARLVGTAGVANCAANAMGISLVEQHWKKKFPGAVTKGFTNDELDKIMASRLRQYSGYSKCAQKGMYSCDFSAMDSSWKFHEKEKIVEIVRKVAARLADILFPHVTDHDPMLTGSDKIMWLLKTLMLRIDVEDAILFSGERGTSLFNRLLVLILRTAELTRLQGKEEAVKFWQCMQKPVDKGGKHQDTGDGDDTAFNNPGYGSVSECVTAYAAYAKHIEPVESDGHCMEVLSRFTTILGGKSYHLAKIERNTQRMVLCCFDAQEAGVPMSAKDHAHVARVMLDRAVACKQTMWLRWYALALCRYHTQKASDKDPKSIKCSHDGSKALAHLGECLRSAEPNSDIWDAYNDVYDMLSAVAVSGYAMVEWTHFGKTMPRQSAVARLAKQWHDIDERARILEISDDDFADPRGLLDRLGLPSEMQDALKIKVKPLTSDVLLAGRLPPNAAEAVAADMGGTNRSRRDKPAAGSESTGVATQGAPEMAMATPDSRPITAADAIAIAIRSAVGAIIDVKGKGKGKSKLGDGHHDRKRGKGRGRSAAPTTDGADKPRGGGIRRLSVAT